LLTDRQTNKLWQKHNLLGGGNNARTTYSLMALSSVIIVTLRLSAPYSRWSGLRRRAITPVKSGHLCD